MSAVHLLCRLLAAYKFTLPVDQVVGDPSLKVLFGLGLAEPRSSGETVLCNACDLMHTARIVIDPVTDILGWRCPEAGFVAASPDNVQLVRALPDVLVSRLADVLECKRRRESPLIERLLWRVGWFEFGKRDVTVYLAAHVRDADDMQKIALSLSSEPSLRNGMILSPNLSGASGLSISGCRFALLGDLLTLSKDRIGCDQRSVAREIGLRDETGPGRLKHEMRSIVVQVIREFLTEKKKFRSKRAAQEAIKATIQERYPHQKVPGRTVIEDEIDQFIDGCFLVGN